MVLFITYLDDLGWAIRPGYSPEERTRINEFIRSTFVRAGWVLSEAKSIFDNNVTELILLGVLIRTIPWLFSTDRYSPCPQGQIFISHR